MKGFKSDSLASYQTASLNIDLLMDKPIDKEKKVCVRDIWRRWSGVEWDVSKFKKG